MKYLVLIPLLLMVISCSRRQNIASLQTHNVIHIIPAYPDRENYDYLISMRNAQSLEFDLSVAESRIEVIDSIMENTCNKYQIAHEQVINIPDLNSSIRDFKNYYYFIKCN
jgi:hypothetical protein